MKAVLVIIYIIGGEPAITTAQFDSQTACQAAREDLLKQIGSQWNATLRVFCYPNWGTKP